MAMMARSAVSIAAAAAVAGPLLLLLVSLLASGAAGARILDGTTMQEACSKTQFPKICVESLAAKPESEKATPRKLAELFVNLTAAKGSGMATFVHGKYNNNAKDDSTLFKCYDSCSDDVEEAVAHLNGVVREPTDGKFLELKSWLSSTLGGTSTCEDACKDLPESSDKEDVVNFSLDFEQMQRVTLDLITQASGSMSAGIALPPSDAGAPSYGAAAPFGGSSAEAPAGSEGPATASDSGAPAGDAPASGGSASAPAGGADADAPAAAASSSGPSGAPAPSSSESSGAPGPSSDAGSSSAPAPSSGGDDDSDDSDDDGSA